MGRLRNEEVRRLLRYLRQHIADANHLDEIEDELRGEYGEEFLREPEILVYFPELNAEVLTAGVSWRLRVIPHAHLRMVQRGINLHGIESLFSRFIEICTAKGRAITTGPYTIFGRPAPRAQMTTLRIDVDMVVDMSGQAHVVTVFVGRGGAAETIEVGPI
jgi:hypothetical protein